MPLHFRIEWSDEASAEYDDLERTNLPKYKKVRRAIGYLSVGSLHSSLETHKFYSISGPNGEQLWVAYVEKNTPAAYRILWYYGPEKRTITVMRVMPHY